LTIAVRVSVCRITHCSGPHVALAHVLEASGVGSFAEKLFRGVDNIAALSEDTTDMRVLFAARGLVEAV